VSIYDKISVCQEENTKTVYVFSGKYRLDLFYIAPFYSAGRFY
jgi:hypothetical protein